MHIDATTTEQSCRAVATSMIKSALSVELSVVLGPLSLYQQNLMEWYRSLVQSVHSSSECIPYTIVSSPLVDVADEALSLSSLEERGRSEALKENIERVSQIIRTALDVDAVIDVLFVMDPQHSMEGELIGIDSFVEDLYTRYTDNYDWPSMMFKVVR